jgi:choline dehydrogenase
MRAKSPFLADLGRAFTASGLEAVRDVSGPDTLEGFGAPTRNARGGTRFHAAAAHLDPARDRPNLTILDRTLVDTVRWEGGRALGLHLVSDDDRWFVEADRVVVSAGTIGSPLILQRSGIGPPDLLRGVLGDQMPLHPLPGVGSNLQDHYGALACYRAAANFFERLGPGDPSTDVTGSQLHARLKSSTDLRAFDLDVLMSYATARPPAPDEALVRCAVYLIQPAARGSVTIRSADPSSAPVIETGFGVSQDVEAIVRGVEWVRDRMHDDRVESWLDVEVAPGIEARGAALRDWVRANLASYHHPIGTCRFGPATDPLAVVDTGGRVHGFDNLYVADASIMPTIPHAQINLTVYAIGEKIGDALAEA